MESRYTIHILPTEWRWVIVVATVLVFLAFAPFLWVALNNPGGWQFMGALHNYKDGASYLSKMTSGEQGDWLIEFQHTPEPHKGGFIQVIYPLLGHLARLIAVPPIVMFHVARVGAALFMYLAFYHLAASIWQRVRTRRIFFGIASVGAGFGWFLAPLFSNANLYPGAVWPDLQIPEAFGLFSTYINVHFPLTLACLALLASVFITVLRPGANKYPGLDSSLAVVGLLSVALSLLYPQALVPIACALALYVVICWLERKYEVARWTVRWTLALVVPAAPMAAYYFALVTDNTAFAEWNRQNVTLAPPLPLLLLGFGLPLLLGLPAIFRAARHFEQDDDRLMLLWLISIVVLIYLPTNVQRRFAVGMILPIAYFATRAVEDFWLRRLGAFGLPALTVAMPLMAVSQIFILFLPIVPLIGGHPESAPGIFLERDYTRVFAWLDGRTNPDDVVLASQVVSLWIPTWAEARVVSAHDYETLYYNQKQAEVAAWYAAPDSADCHALLDRYHVSYVIVGPEERKLGAAACVASLNRVITVGQVSVYAP